MNEDFNNKNTTGVGKIIIAVVITICLCSLIFFTFYYFILRPNMMPAEDSRYAEIIKKIKALDEKIDGHYLFDSDKKELENNMYFGYVYGLNDEYADYYTAEQYEEYLTSQRGNFSGIGIRVTSSSDPISDGIFVYRVLGNSPSEEEGLQVGDYIIGVDGNSIIGEGYDDSVSKIRGPAGSSVSLTIKRGEEEIVLTVPRRSFVQKEVEYRVLEGNIGFIRVHEFNTNAFSEFSAAVTQLAKENVKGLIIDLRNNPGGELQTVVNMVDCLVDGDQEIAIIASNEGETVLRSTSVKLLDVPVVVLINEGSASASELFSSAMRDLNGAKLVGKQSYGKQIGQTTYYLYDSSAVKMTTFRYYTASRTDYNAKGLVPDVEIDLDPELAKYFYALEDSQDTQLTEAIKVIKEIIK